MKAILVFIDGTICDGGQRIHLYGSEEFYHRERILEDLPVPGSSVCLQKLSLQYKIVYIGARPAFTEPATREWLLNHRYPAGEIYLAEHQSERLLLTKEAARKYDFLAGIGDRWDDNEIHNAIGCMSIILQEHAGEWESVPGRITQYYKNQKINQNRIHLEGKVEGLARVCPLLFSRFGEKLWDAYHTAVLEMAENLREANKAEDLEFFRLHGLDAGNMADVAKMYQLWDEESWETDPLFGLQDRELVESTKFKYIHKVTRCYYADLWKKHGKPEIGYQIHCRTDAAWWDHPAWNEEVRFEQPKTLMQGDDCCLFIQYLPNITNRTENE